ncbi:hypothetical protein ACFO5K_12515 [Nocardia halotolerans]|uniref:SMODS and SLOG-associating 2TM effector domain-containing protein n=1 Tax=Nocardia halotolerans TaxID=1755878 RepID=A0ABV8VG08_9NOCA
MHESVPDLKVRHHDGQSFAIYINASKITPELQEKVTKRSIHGAHSIDADAETPTPFGATIQHALMKAHHTGIGLLIFGFLLIVILGDDRLSALLGADDPFMVVCIALPLLAGIFTFSISTIWRRYREWKILNNPLTLNHRDTDSIRRATDRLDFTDGKVPNIGQFEPGECRCRKLAGRISLLHRSIVGSQSWSGPHLTDQRSELSLDVQYREIVRDILSFHIDQEYLGPRPEGAGVAAELAKREWDLANEVLDAAWSTLTDWASGYEALNRTVSELDQVLEHSSITVRAGAVSERAAHLAGRREIHALSESNLHNQSRYVAAVTSAIAELVEIAPSRLEAIQAIAPDRLRQ